MSVDRLYAIGDDALGSLWDMAIGVTPFLSDLEQTILRVHSITIPGTGVGVYEVPYKTQKITKPSGKVEAPNEFTFDFRVDRNWLIYKGFIAWKNAVANSYTGAIAPDNVNNNLRVPIQVWAVDANGDAIPDFGKWSFKGCFPSNIGDVALDYTNGEPISVTVTMQFLGLDDNVL